MEFNRLIKKWRRESGMTLDELSKKTNLTIQAISLYENEKRTVSHDTLKVFANALNKKVELEVREVGLIPMTKTQRKKIEEILYSELSTKEQFEFFKELFDITDNELRAGKLYDDMDVKEYLRYSPVKTMINKDGFLFNKNKHSDEVLLYYLCNGGKAEYDENGGYKSVSIPNDLEEFKPHRRTSEGGFITEQRRRLLLILKECFRVEDDKNRSFNFRKFKNKIGL